MTTTANTIETVTLDVAGMTCGSCERHIKQELNQVAGYRDAQVGIAEGRVRVTYDASASTPADLVEAIVRAGYPAALAATESPAPARASGSSCSCCAPKAL